MAATTLTNVEVREVGEASVLELVADGTIANAETFTLEDPDRLVIDLPGLVSRVARRLMPVDSPEVSRVRIGAHPDKVTI